MKTPSLASPILVLSGALALAVATATPVPAGAQVIDDLDEEVPERLPEADIRIVDDRRCIRGTLGDLLCAEDEQGVALENALGVIVCAPGACMHVQTAEATAWDSEWLCSSVSGGEVRLGPDGPVCEGGCQSPRETDCTQY